MFQKFAFTSHITGYTDVAYYGTDSKLIVSTGVDSYLNVIPTDQIKSNTSPEILSVQYHLGASTCVDASESVIVTTSLDHEACSFTVDNENKLTHSATLTRCQFPTRHISLDKKSKQAAISTDEGVIKIVNLSDPSKQTNLKGHRRVVKCSVFDPKADYLASVDSDGSVRIWDILDLSQVKCTKILVSFAIKANPETNNMCKMEWDPSGSYLAIPTHNKEITLLEHETWNVVCKIGPNPDNVTAVCWSPNGAYLTACCLDGSLVVWKPSLSIQKPVACHKLPSLITGACWSPKVNEFCIADEKGDIHYSTDFIPAEFEGKSIPSPIVQIPKAELAINKNVTDPNVANLFEEQPQAPPVPVEKPQNFIRNSISLEDEEDEYDNMLMDDIAYEDDMDDFVVDNDGLAKDVNHYKNLKENHEPPKRRPAPHSPSKDRKKKVSYLASADNQDAFQPNVTPKKANKLYLSFNLVGVVYSVDQGIHSTVHVEFHDRSRKAFHLTDPYPYTMAALGNEGIVFACPSDHKNPGTVYYRPTTNFNSNNEWTYQLDELENPKVVALTSKDVVVATDAGYLRFFSVGGVQTGIISLKGPIVSMCGSKDFLFIVYHAGSAFHGDQNLGFMILDSNRIVLKDEVSLSPSSQLTWVGYSENGMPLTYDSLGVLRGLSEKEKYWIPLLDTKTKRSNVEDTFWPVGVFESNFMCVICKGSEKYPTFPKPMLMELPLSIPLVNVTAGQSGELEEKLVMHKLLTTNENDIKRLSEQDKLTLRLHMAACKASKTQRAQDLCELLNLDASIDGAIKIALHHHLPSLAERINVIKEHKIKEREENLKKDQRGTHTKEVIERVKTIYLPAPEPEVRYVEKVVEKRKNEDMQVDFEDFSSSSSPRVAKAGAFNPFAVSEDSRSKKKVESRDLLSTMKKVTANDGTSKKKRKIENTENQNQSKMRNSKIATFFSNENAESRKSSKMKDSNISGFLSKTPENEKDDQSKTDEIEKESVPEESVDVKESGDMDDDQEDARSELSLAMENMGEPKPTEAEAQENQNPAAKEIDTETAKTDDGPVTVESQLLPVKVVEGAKDLEAGTNERDVQETQEKTEKDTTSEKNDEPGDKENVTEEPTVQKTVEEPASKLASFRFKLKK